MNLLEYQIWIKDTEKRVARIQATKGYNHDSNFANTWKNFRQGNNAYVLALKDTPGYKNSTLEILEDMVKSIEKYLDLLERHPKFLEKETTITSKHARGHHNLSRYLKKYKKAA
jgi:hypothetical protein